MSIDLRDSRVLVTGATGFLGKHLVEELRKQGVRHVVGQGGVKTQYNQGWEAGTDLAEIGNAEFVISGGFDYVFHLAGYNGGIEFNRKYPADIFYRNTVMGLNLLDACRKHGVKKVVSVVASCAYPEYEHKFYEGEDVIERELREIMVEDGFLDGPPHPSVACHGYAKRNLQLASQFYKQQYGLNAVCACPTTLYGPGDSWDPERTKVMGGMVKRFVDAADANLEEVTCWGTGAPYREFLYVEDAAILLVEAMRHYENSSMPLNLGTGQEHTTKQLAELVARLAGYTGRILWDTSRPDGQMRKRLDMTRMVDVLPVVPITSLDTGITKTIEYYRSIKGRE